MTMPLLESRRPGQRELILEAGARARKLAALREIWAFRGTVLAFAERDIRVKYKQAVLGVVWAVLQPLLFMAVFTVTLGHLAKVPGGGVSYAAFSLSALVPWTYLSGSVTFGANELVTDAAMIRRVYFPREVPVLSTIVSSSLDFAIGLALFFIVGPLIGAHVMWTWLLTPILFALLALLAVSVSLPLGGAERLLPGLPVRGAVRDPTVALRLTRRIPLVGRPRPLERALRRDQPGGGDPGWLFERPCPRGCARHGVLGISLLGTS